MDALLAGLEENEQEYIRLRFEKGYGIDYRQEAVYQQGNSVSDAGQVGKAAASGD